MKVTGPNGLGQAGPAKTTRAAAPGFSLGATGAATGATQAASVHGPSGVSSVDALIALQQVDSPLERRRRAVRRGGQLLDMLDQMKLSLLDGEVSPAALRNLGAAVRERQDDTGDAKLQSVLREIEARAAVELAKLEMARQAA